MIGRSVVLPYKYAEAMAKVGIHESQSGHREGFPCAQIALVSQWRLPPMAHASC